MRAMRILAAVVLACAGLVCVTASPAFACSCVAEGKRAQLSRAGVVFVGTLTDRSQDGDDMTGSVTYTFDVIDVYEGETASPVEVTTGVQGSACGIPGLVEDETYLVLAGAVDGDELSTSSCSGTAEAAPALVERVAELSGPPTNATAAPPDDRPGALVVAAVVAAVATVLAAGVLLVRSARR